MIASTEEYLEKTFEVRKSTMSVRKLKNYASQMAKPLFDNLSPARTWVWLIGIKRFVNGHACMRCEGVTTNSKWKSFPCVRPLGNVSFITH